MHQQMLARYDTERLALGMPVTQWLDHTQPIAEGYVAELPGFSNRPPNARLSDVALGDGRTYRVQDHSARRERLFGAATTGAMTNGPSTTRIDDISLLGSTI